MAAVEPIPTRLMELRDLLVGRIIEALNQGIPVHVRADYDGVGAEFPHPASETIPLRLFVRALDRLSALPGVTAGIVTSRSLEFMARHFPNPRIELDCSNGAESRHSSNLWRHHDVVAAQTRIHELVQAVLALSPQSSTNLRDAQRNDGLYVDVTARGMTLRVGPAKSSRSNSTVERQLAGLLPKLAVQFPEFEVHVDSYRAALSLDIGSVDKGEVVNRLEGLVIYAGDGSVDVPAAIATQQKNGLVIAVDSPPDKYGRTGSSRELVGLADIVVDRPDNFARLLDAVARGVEAHLRQADPAVLFDSPATLTTGEALV